MIRDEGARLGFGGDKVHLNAIWGKQANATGEQSKDGAHKQAGPKDNDETFDAVLAVPVRVLPSRLGPHRAALCGIDDFVDKTGSLIDGQQFIANNQDFFGLNLAFGRGKQDIVFNANTVPT